MKWWIRGGAFMFLIAAASAQAGNTVIHREAEKVGVQQCLEAVKKVSDRVMESSSHEADITWNTEDPDGRVFSLFVSKGRFDGDNQVNIQFIPSRAGGCDIVVTETFVVQKTCEKFREHKLGGMTFRGVLNRRTTVLQGANNSVSVYLTPAGIASDLCIVTHREVAYSTK